MQVFPISGWPQTKGKKRGGCLVSSALTNKFLYGNFGEKYLSNGTGIFFFLVPKKGLKCTICKVPVHFLPSLLIQGCMVRKISVFSVKTKKKGST